MSRSQAIPHVEEACTLTPQSDSNQTLPPVPQENHHDLAYLEARVGITSEKPAPSEDSNFKDIVDFEGPDDPYKPLNWPTSKKMTTTLLYGFTTAGATWASSIYSVATGKIEEEFGVGEVVSTLGLTLFLFGFGLGPLLWAPLSEAYGRKVAVLPPYFIAGCFCFGTAASKDIQTVLITRFFTGFFGAAPVTNTGGVLNDVWLPEYRGTATLGYSMAVVGGPLISPVVGAAIIQSSLDWRWVFYLTGIIMMVIFFLDAILVDESSAAILLNRKAARLRQETGKWVLHSKQEETGVNMNTLVTKYLVRPWLLLCDPICLFMVLYSSFVYGIVYLNFGAFPIEFESVRNWSPVVASLPFLATFIGALLAGVSVLYNQRFYVAQLKANNNKPVPEARLRPMMIGSVVFVVGLFVFAWTSNPKIHWIGGCLAAALMGFGFFSIFQCSVNYLVDTFQIYAASALAASTLVRSIFAGAFPLFTKQMFEKLGVDWAVSLLGFVAVAMVPIPFIFKIYGKKIRARGNWSKASTL